MLIVEEDPATRFSITSWFRGCGYSVAPIPRYGTLLRAYEESRPDLVLVDQTLKGMAFLGVLRLQSNVPIIVIARPGDTEDTRIRALELGADDVISPGREMLARARAVLRRAQQLTNLDSTVLHIDRVSRQIRKGGKLIPAMPEREFELLAFFAASPHRAFNHSELLEEVWGVPMDRRHVKAVIEHVYRLRRRIEDNPERPKHLITVRGVGYRFEP